MAVSIQKKGVKYCWSDVAVVKNIYYPTFLGCGKPTDLDCKAVPSVMNVYGKNMFNFETTEQDNESPIAFSVLVGMIILAELI